MVHEIKYDMLDWVESSKIKELTGCIKPCRYKKYTFIGERYQSALESEYFFVSFWAVSGKTQVKTEQLIYPWPTLWQKLVSNLYLYQICIKFVSYLFKICLKFVTNLYQICIKFVSGKTQVKTEQLIYPLGYLVAEFGGILSLFLGFSFISLWDHVHLIKHGWQIFKGNL